MGRAINFGTALGFALKFGFTGVPTALRLGWLPLIVFAVGGIIFGTAYWQMMSLLFDAPMGDGPDAFDPAAMGMGRMALAYLLFLLGGLLFLPVYVGLIRQAAGLPRERGGLFGYRFGVRELKVLAAGIVNGVILGAAMLLIFAPVIGLAAAEGASSAPSGWLIAIGVLFAIGAGCLVVWLGVRLSLLVPLTAAENRLSVGEAWRTTKQRFWILLALFVVVIIIAGIVVQVFQLVGMMIGAAIGAGTGGFSPEAMEANPLAAMGPMMAMMFLFGMVGSLYQNLVMTGLAGHVLGEIRGYGDDSIDEVFA